MFANSPEVHTQVESYQRLKKWYLIFLCLTLSIIRYVSRVKWHKPRKGIVPSPTPRRSSHWKRNHGRQIWLLYNSRRHLVLSFFLISRFTEIALIPSLLQALNCIQWWYSSFGSLESIATTPGSTPTFRVLPMSQIDIDEGECHTLNSSFGSVLLLSRIALTAGGVEYTNCTSAEE